MDDIAERGFAAHWKYKIGEGEEESELNNWLGTIEDILKNPEPNALDFLDTIKLNLFSVEIVVFTPKGELITLPKDASVLDLAFRLHTEIGTHCIAGKVNHKLVPLSQKLRSGDQVEVLTSQSQHPHPEWENFLVTATGKTRLRAALRHQRREIIERGSQTLTAYMTDHNIPQTPENLTHIIANVQAKNKDDLYLRIGKGEVTLSDDLFVKGSRKGNSLLNKILRLGNRSKDNTTNQQQTTDNAREAIDTKKIYELHTDRGKSNYHLAECCHPIPGDDVAGFVNEHNQVVVHKIDCPVMQRLKAGYGSRLVQTLWADPGEKFLVTLHIEGIDRMGILQEIIHIISTNLNVNIRRLEIQANEGVFSCELEVLIDDASEATNLCKQLKKVDGVNAATRLS